MILELASIVFCQKIMSPLELIFYFADVSLFFFQKVETFHEYQVYEERGGGLLCIHVRVIVWRLSRQLILYQKCQPHG